ncbi:MAG: tetratricopeptide repeat protein [Bacteroidota bacterium]
MNRNRYFFTLSLLVIFSLNAVSQVLFTGDELASDLTRGMELFNKEKYAAAIRLFDSYISDNEDRNHIMVSEAEYYRSVAALALFNPDAEYRMVSYIRTHAESPRINEAYLGLGDYFYQNKNYRKAVTYYEEVNQQELPQEKLPEYFFRLGYSHFIRGEKPRALLMFSEIKDIDTEYTAPALYYFSHIAYEQEMYQTAMDGFSRLKGDETFGSVVPFYIVQILYLQKDYDQILEIAPSLINSAGKEREVELYRFIGDAHYNKGNFSEALPYLEKFSTGTKISGREDQYQLAYCYYKTGDLDKAIKMLREIDSRNDLSRNDLLSQNIWYILGDCYLQKGDRKRAQYGFSEASKLDFDKKIKEDALFNYAKITYETSYSPFGEATASFQKYIELYPGSERIQEVYNYLVSTYLQAKNYKAALASLDRIKNKESQLEEAYQRVAFFRGLELFKNMELQAAADMFDKSLKYGKYDRQMKARAVYWRGEANYRLGNLENAKADYAEFMALPGSLQHGESNLVRYNLGYTFYNLQDYTNALTHLKAFESDVVTVRPEVMADARNRIGDCYYITTSYPEAISYYDKVIDFGKIDADYAMFQKGFSLGLMNDEHGKADVLTLLTTRYPSSAYVPNAIFERGRAYLVLNEFSRGEEDFNTVIKSYPATPFVPRAMVQLGLLYYNTGQNGKAVEQYKKVIENYKSTPEARYALTGLRNSCVEMNDVEGYFTYLKTLQGYGDVNLSEKDSLLYTSGENLYITGNYARAVEVFRNYLIEFPNGSFLQNAQFYLAESLNASGGNREEALKYYTAVAGAPNNQFTEQSLIAAAGIYYGLEDFASSLKYYEMLEQSAGNSENKIIALRGGLRSAYQLGDAQKSITTADKVINTVNVPEELFREAVFMKAKANYSLNNFREALADFRRTSYEVASIEGAESKYRVAELLFKDNQVTESEKVINEFIDQNTPHQYWMARMFILLSDISVSKGDKLQARATLQSLKDYYTIDNDGILDEVKAKLDALGQGN